MPVLTVIMPVYNGQDFLEKAISSVLNQSFDDFILLIIDDGSTDNSPAIISSFKSNKIVYSRNSSNKGLIETLNKGLSMNPWRPWAP